MSIRLSPALSVALGGALGGVSGWLIGNLWQIADVSSYHRLMMISITAGCVVGAVLRRNRKRT
jgi:branched-subunit amino acid ABC-type transport system permease component